MTHAQERARIQRANREAGERWIAAPSPVGTPVSVRRDNGREFATVTRSAPWQTGDGTWLIGVAGISGGYALERVTVQQPMSDDFLAHVTQAGSQYDTTCQQMAAEILRLRSVSLTETSVSRLTRPRSTAETILAAVLLDCIEIDGSARELVCRHCRARVSAIAGSAVPHLPECVVGQALELRARFL